MDTKKKTYDLTQGPILNRLLLVALPIMGTMVMQMAYNLTDMFWLGKLGSEALAASGAAGMFLWLSMAFMMLGRMGSEIGVSQSLGANNREAAKSYSQSAVLVAATAGAFFAVMVIFFSPTLISFFGIREKGVADDAARYLSIAGVGCLPLFIASAIGGTFTGSGNSRLPFYINAVGIVLNITLDPLFIFTAGWGITGAAIATVIAQSVVCLLSVLAVLFHKDRPFSAYRFFVKPNAEKIARIIKWSAPIALESFLFSALTMTVSRFIAAFGVNALAVSRIGSQIESLSWLIGGGFASAVTAFTGQNFGAGKWSRIHKSFRLSVAVMCVWGLAVTSFMFFLGRNVFGIFLQDPDVLVMGAEYMRILAFCQIFMCLEGVSSSIFRGIGETIKPSIVSIASNVLRVPLAYLLSLTGLGLTGLWIGVTAGACLRGSWVFIWLLIRKRRLSIADERADEGQAGG
jgi:putative MATE family efflux protein